MKEKDGVEFSLVPQGVRIVLPPADQGQKNRSATMGESRDHKGGRSNAPEARFTSPKHTLLHGTPSGNGMHLELSHANHGTRWAACFTLKISTVRASASTR